MFLGMIIVTTVNMMTTPVDQDVKMTVTVLIKPQCVMSTSVWHRGSG